MTKERKKKDLLACLKEEEVGQKIVEASLKHVKTEKEQLSQEVKDLKKELSSEKKALKAMQ